MAHLSPAQGGCWYCCQDNESVLGGMYFCHEYDTFIHAACLAKLFRAQEAGEIDMDVDVESSLILSEFECIKGELLNPDAPKIETVGQIVERLA